VIKKCLTYPFHAFLKERIEAWKGRKGRIKSRKGMRRDGML